MGSTEEDQAKGQSQEGSQKEKGVNSNFVDIKAVRNYAEQQQKDRSASTPRQNFKVSRDLMGNLTPALPAEGDLFSMLEEQQAQTALMLSEKGRLFSTCTDGLAGGGAVKKAALYLAREIFQQASAYGDPLKEGFNELVKRGQEMGFAASRLIGGVRMPSLFIKVTLSEATKWIKGANNSANREDVDAILRKLAENFIYWRSPDGTEHIKMMMITIEAEYTNERTRQKEYLIEVRPQFYMGITKGFVTASERCTTLLPKLKKDLEVNLFFYTLELLSFKSEKGYPVLKRSADKVEARVIPEYYIKGSRKKDLKRDFAKAINLLIDGELLQPQGITTELGSDGKTCFYVFHLNPDYTKTSTEIPQETT